MDNFGRIYRNKRNEGIHIVAGRGSGKSYFLGRFLAMDDYIHEVPTVIFDNGDTIDNFIDMHRRFFQGIGKSDARSHKRIVYVPIGGYEIEGEIGPICPFPLYRRFNNESAFEVSQRFVETVRRLDPELSTASIQGYNPLWQIGTMAGKILIALGLQITEMRDLILHPDLWGKRFKKAIEEDPSVKDAVEFFTLQYPNWPEQWKASLTRKLTLFTAEDNYKALFGSYMPGINWDEVIEEKKIVLLDFRNVHNEELQRFLMLWIFSNLRDFVLHRGTGGSPISIIVDELSGMMNLSDSEGSSLIAKDLDRLLNTIMRRHNLWITFAHQAMNQFPPSIQSLLLGMGTQVFGRIDNMDDALHLAKSFFPVDTLKVKRTTKVKRPFPIFKFTLDNDIYKARLIQELDREAEIKGNYWIDEEGNKRPSRVSLRVFEGQTIEEGEGYEIRLHDVSEFGQKFYVRPLKVKEICSYLFYADSEEIFDDYLERNEELGITVDDSPETFQYETKIGYQDRVVEEPVEYTIPEQHYENANRLTSLPQFSFLVRPAGENEPSDYYITTEGEFVDREEVENGKAVYMINWMVNKAHMSVRFILSDINRRLDQDAPEEAQDDTEESQENRKPKPQTKKEVPAQKVRIVGKKLND